MTVNNDSSFGAFAPLAFDLDSAIGNGGRVRLLGPNADAFSLRPSVAKITIPDCLQFGMRY